MLRYAGRKAHERPIRFYLDDREYLVEDILDQWCGPAHTVFEVRASDGHVYILRYRRNQDKWTLVAFRRS
jgi:hypothetical protein